VAELLDGFGGRRGRFYALFAGGRQDSCKINTRKVAEGPVAEAFNAESLQAAYGGRLATAQVDQIASAIG
ncbi:MAG: hypothetical protein AAGA05_09290, partial [Pseudomonadota bacterium]